MITRRRFLRGSLGGLGVAAATGLYTWRVEPHWLELVQRRLPVANLPPDLRGCRLVQLSDLHIGPQVDESYLRRSFQRVADLAPEFVVYTGDLTTYEADILARVRRMCQHLPLGRFGTFGVLGNHDYGPGWADLAVAERIADLVAGAGVRVLRNEWAEARGLHLVGLDDLWARQFDPAAGFRALPPDAAALALSHNPDSVDLGGWQSYRGWILAGHTHGGQCKPPFLPAPLLSVRNRRYTAGEFALSGDRRLYINRGLGHTFPVRFNVRPEITVFHLDRV